MKAKEYFYLFYGFIALINLLLTILHVGLREYNQAILTGALLAFTVYSAFRFDYPKKKI